VHAGCHITSRLEEKSNPTFGFHVLVLSVYYATLKQTKPLTQMTGGVLVN